MSPRLLLILIQPLYLTRRCMTPSITHSNRLNMASSDDASQQLSGGTPSSSSSSSPSSFIYSRASRGNDSTPGSTQACDSLPTQSGTSNVETAVVSGLLSPTVVDTLLNRYIDHLSFNKRAKAVITRAMYIDIEDALVNSKSSVRTPQFRHWARNNFNLSMNRVTQKGVRVAVREDFHEILCQAHVAVAHGGRDKTYAEVARHWAHVPKEVVASFVALCPTCQAQRAAVTPRSNRAKAT